MAINPNDISVDSITPDSHIWLLKGVPLEPNYENTILWEATYDYVNGQTINGETIAQARERQFQWFTLPSTKFDKIESDTTTYLREGRKYVRIDKPMKDLIGYNYMIFKNEGDYNYSGTTLQKYENKYWYAFITRLEYLNDRVTIIHYSIDLMQTFMFDCTPAQCFVEREHSATDQIGDNTLDENLPVGDVLYYDKGSHPQLRNWEIGIFTSKIQKSDWSGVQSISGSMVGNMYSGLHLITTTSESTANNFLTFMTDEAASEAIVSINMVPTYFASAFGGTPVSIEWQIDRDINWVYSHNGKIGPRNKKLYCYPYNKLYITNNNGESNEYHYELFNNQNNNKVFFDTIATMLGNGEISIIPMNYRVDTQTGSPDSNNGRNYNERMTLTGMPQCSFTIDSYRAWLAQNKGQIIAEQVSAAQTIALGSSATFVGAVGVNPGEGIVSGLNMLNNGLQQVESLMGKNYDMSRKPPIVQTQNTPSLAMQEGFLNFRAYNVRVKPEYASMIDDYFDLFGYACRRLKVPNRNVRENWCYCKTVGCRLYGTITGDVDEKICSIYNNGIRFWKNGNNIGSYNTVRNRCVSEIQP